MPVAPTYPGVYVQEVSSGVHTIVGVGTSTALIIGSCKNGPLGVPVMCHSYTEFVLNFSEDGTLSDLPRYVKLFFLNGGTSCYVMRIANGAAQATVQLMTEGGAPANSLLLTATNAGDVGNRIRAAVDYDTDQPEATFNIEVFRWDTDANGNTVKAASERWRNLSMDPGSANFAPAFLTQNSRLVNASVAAAPAPGSGFSQAGRAVNMAGGGFAARWSAIVTNTANQFQISVAGSPYQQVDLSGLVGAMPGSQGLLAAAIQAAVRLPFAALPGNPGAGANVSFVNAPSVAIPAGADTPRWLQISTVPNADVFIRPSPTNDVAVALMLGTAQGGYEVGAYAAARPAPTGTSLLPSSIFAAFAAVDPSLVTGLTIGGTAVPIVPNLETGPPTQAMTVDSSNPATSKNGNGDGIREKLNLIAQNVADFAAANANFPWKASVWGYRLNLTRRDGADNAIGVLTFPAWLGPAGFADTENVRFFSLGLTGVGPYQVAGTKGIDGGTPAASDYANAYPVADREIDLFNILVLPSANGLDQKQLWPAASVFCRQRRAILLMDPPPAWQNAADAKNGVSALRVGVVTDYSAIYFPRLTVNENGLSRQVGPTGAIAGLMARIDSSRGVWKAPAGTEADLRGISGLERRFSDLENGDLNPKAINTLRAFPNGVVCWGARTMAGDDSNPTDFKYVPIRRLSLFIEESLYRGLTWVVFEPNDEPLWAQIRLNVGAFMHGLFTQGAFAGKKSTDAYFVRCDAETTTQDDRNKGIVNIWVGFAPLKPAEFVVLYLQQMAGNITV